MAIVSANGGVLDMSFFFFGPFDPENVGAYSSIDAQMDQLSLIDEYSTGDVDYSEFTLFQGRFDYTYDGSAILISDGLITSIDYVYDEVDYGGDSGTEFFSVQNSISGLALTVADYRAPHPEGIAAFLLSGDDLVTGGNGDDIMFGAAGDDTIRGGGGDDWLEGGQGADIMVGGEGNDIYVVDDADDIVVEATGDDGIDLVISTISYVLGVALDGLLLDGADPMTGVGNSSHNAIAGNDGVSCLFGLVGDDLLLGGLGDDLLNGGVGADALDGGGGLDTISYADAESGVIVSLSNSPINTGEAEGDSFYSIENIIGSAFRDSLNGSGKDNVIDGGAGNDRMKGGRGDDIYIVDSRLDVVIELSNFGHDTVLSSTSYRLSANVEDLSLTTAMRASAIGNEMQNVITGGDGDNIIAGKGGADTLTGGAGSDTFDYNAITESSDTEYDRITDLTDADKIDLAGIDANTGVAGNQNFSFVSAFTNHAGEVMLTYDSVNGVTAVLADVNGDSVADLKIVLDGNHHDFTNFVF